MYLLTTLLAKISNLIINVFKIGSGLTWPGHLALKFFPKSLSISLRNLPKGFILISGTNGKTTTAKLISHVLQRSNFKTVSNKSGANLLNGILSALLLDTNFFGKPKSDIGIFEVDEFALPSLLTQASPRILLLLNLSRDQLDRYGEVDIIFDRWLRALKVSSPDFSVIADISQEEFKRIGDFYKGKVIYFNDSTTYLERTKLTGKHNAKNLNACLVVCNLLNLNIDKSVEVLKDFDPAYGRGESLTYKGKSYKILLAKNPASFNTNLDLLNETSSLFDSLIFILNDNIPDGRDISWIYDVDAFKLESVCSNKKIFVIGQRSYDMAVRLKYAGVPSNNIVIFDQLQQLLKEISKDKNVNSIVVLPNYSAMLNFRKVVLGRKIL
jgi:lipid II isoglutaminyl synthase (glutamine-hydrolysing)